VPLYAYRCTQCGHGFEKIQSFSAEPETVCPQCGGKLERPLTAPRLQFKGAGWYVNDYASKSSPSSPSSDAGSSEAKPASSEPAAAETKKSSDSSNSAAPAASTNTSGTSASNS